METRDEAVRLAEGGPELPDQPLLGRVISFFGLLGIVVLLVPIVLTCADIVWRQLVGGSFVDTFDITQFCLVAAASWSIPYGFVHGTHVTVDLLAEQLPARAQHILDAAIHLVAAALVAFLAWVSWQGAMLHYAYGDTTLNLQIPVIYYWAIFLSGLVLAFLACLLRAWMALSGTAGRGAAL